MTLSGSVLAFLPKFLNSELSVEAWYLRFKCGRPLLGQRRLLRLGSLPNFGKEFMIRPCGSPPPVD